MSAWDDPNSRRMSNRAETDKLYKKLLKKKQYAELLRLYLNSRCCSPEIWEAYKGLVRQADKGAVKTALRQRGWVMPGPTLVE